MRRRCLSIAAALVSAALLSCGSDRPEQLLPTDVPTVDAEATATAVAFDRKLFLASEERTAGEVDVLLARLGSTSSVLPEPDEKTESVLGFVTLDFHVLEYLKPKSPEILGTVQSTVHVGYECLYAENNRRDREALVRVENKLQEIRDRVNAVIAEEVDRGVECVGALYRHRWYTRSGEEEWYRGELGPDNVPVECSQ